MTSLPTYPLSSVEQMTPDQMAAELLEMQQLAAHTDPAERAKLTPERLRRGVRIMYHMNQSRTGPRRVTRKKTNETDAVELPNPDELVAGLPSADDLAF